MKTKKQQPRASFLSIDDWQDKKSTKVRWFDNPVVGTSGVIVVIACLFSWSAVASSKANEEGERVAADVESHARPPVAPQVPEDPAVAESSSLDEALAELSGNSPAPALKYLGNSSNFDPSRKKLVQDKLLKVLATNPSCLQNDLMVFFHWFHAADSPRITDLIRTSPDHEACNLVRALSHLPNARTVLVSELTMHKTTSAVYHALRQELRNTHVSSETILGELANQLRFKDTADEFGRIVLVLNTIASETADNPTLKRLIAEAMTSASRNLTSEQLDKMDWTVGNAIKTLAQVAAKILIC